MCGNVEAKQFIWIEFCIWRVVYNSGFSVSLSRIFLESNHLVYMEPDYASYTREELIQAYESIDRNAYPDRFEKIKLYLDLEGQDSDALPVKFAHPVPEFIEGHFQNKVMLGIVFIVAFFIIGIWGTKHFLIDGSDTNPRQLSFPLMCIVAPFGIWHVRRRWQKHQYDLVKFDSQSITYKKRDDTKTLSWSELSTVWIVRKQHSIQYGFLPKSGTSIKFFLVHFDLDPFDVKSFVRAKSKEHGFKFEKIGWMGFSRDQKKQ